MRWSNHRRPRLERLEDRLAPSFGAVGPEFRVNSYTTGEQSKSAVASDADGDFVAVWSSFGQDGSNFGIYAQRYSSSGSALGGEFRVNTFTSNNQMTPAVAMNAAGDFVVAWASGFQDGSGYGIYAQRYSSSGAALGGEFRVNATTAGGQITPSVAMNAVGDFSVAWAGPDVSGYGIFARRYSAAGVPVSGEFAVNQFVPGAQTLPAVAIDPAGNSVVVWQSYLQDFDSQSVFMRRFNAAGTALANEVPVNQFTTGSQRTPQVAMAAAGNFAIVWTSGGNQDGNNDGVYARRYTATGNAIGNEFRVNTTTSNAQNTPAIAAGADGSFVVGWQSSGQESIGNIGIFARRYNAAGAAVGGEIHVNTFMARAQFDASIAVDADGDFTVAWSSDYQTIPSGGYDIYAQRYTDLDDNGDTAGPIVTSVRPTGASQPIAPNGILVSNPRKLTVGFSEAMAVSGAGSVMVPANWELRENGFIIPGGAAITGITFGLNAATNQYEAVLNISRPLYDTRYTLTASSAIQDANGNALDGNRDGSPGDEYSLTFDVKPVTPRGPETRVNTVTTGAQELPAIAVDSVGNYIVVWYSNFKDGSGGGVYGQRYSKTGATLGLEFRVNQFTVSDQGSPAVAASANGDFVVVWESSNQDGNFWDIYGQRYSADGMALGGEFHVNSAHPTDFQRRPNVAMDAAGNFVVAWNSLLRDGSDYGVYARRYSAAGAPLGGEFRVNTTTTGPQIGPAVGMSAGGDLLIAWSSRGQDGDGYGVFAQRYSAAGAPLGGEFAVNQFTTSNQGGAAVGMDAAGQFAIAWVSQLQDGSGDGVYARRFGASGSPLASEFLVNTRTSLNQADPSVGMDADGDFVVAWDSRNQDGGNEGIYAQRYDGAGATVGGEFRINTTTLGAQQSPAVGMSATGDFVAAWESAIGDGDGLGIYSQRYFANLTPRLYGLPNVTILPNRPTDISLAAGFFDYDDGEAGLTYSIIDNSNPALFSSATIVGSTLTVTPALSTGVAFLAIRATDPGGAYSQTTFSVTVAPNPQISQTLINSGTDSQRSRVTSLRMSFSTQVSFVGAVADAFTLTRNGGGAVSFTATENFVLGKTVITLNNFTGGEAEFGSLRDGRYTLTALASKINVGGLALDGNGDGVGGDDYTFGDAQGLNRFYGDMNGDSRVDISDFGFFSLAYLSQPNYNAALDFNNDGRIDIIDFGQFSVRYFTSLP